MYDGITLNLSCFVAHKCSSLYFNKQYPIQGTNQVGQDEARKTDKSKKTENSTNTVLSYENT